jgi:hypothetical protein
MARIGRSTRAGWPVAIAVAAAIFGATTTPHAEDRAAGRPDQSLEADLTESARRQRIDRALAADRVTSLRWYLGWSSLFLVSAGVRTGLVLGSHDHDLVAESRVVLVTSLLGLLTTAPVPPPSLGTEPAPPADAVPAVRQAHSERQKKRLERAAELERLGRSPLAHFGGIVVNVSAGLYLWKVDHLPRAGLLTALTGIAVSEAKIATQPTGAQRTFEAERSAQTARARVWAVVPSVFAGGGGVTVVGAF